MRRLLIALTSLSVVAAMVAIATPAGAAFPGANGKIVFAFMSSDVNDTNEIYTMNPDGTDRTRLTNNSAADYYPAVSPDGSKIAFASLRDGNPEIYVMNLDGSGQTRLTSNSWIDFSPAWSPDGSKIAFGSTRDGNYEIYVMNADGTGQTNLTNNVAEDQSAVWSPDGAKIAFDSTRNGNRDVFTMNADGTGQTNMTNTPGFDENPDWSPDASKIAFDSFRDGNYEVYLMNADGTGQTRLTSDPSYDVWPVWSPDGTKVAFASGRDGNTEIYTMNPDGTGQTRVTNNSTSDFYLDWQPLPPPVVYSNDFSSSIGGEWSSNARILPTPGGQVLGSDRFGSPAPIGSETLTLALTGLPAHSSVHLSVDLYTLRSWDGNTTNFGPDQWDLDATGTASDVQPLTTFSNYVSVNQSYPDAHPGGSNPGTTGSAASGDLLGLGSSGNGEIPAVRYDLSYSFAHTTSSVTFSFAGSNLQGWGDEGWVLDDVVVSVTETLQDEPVASFTAVPNPAGCDQAITFDASSSTHTNPARSIVSYAWDFGDGTSASGMVTTHPYAAFGSYTTTLTVTDDNAPPRTDTATQAISVNQGNSSPVARPGGPYTVPLGEGITLDGSSSTDPDTACGDSIVAYEWNVGNGAFQLSGATPSITSQQVDTLGAGTHPVSLTVRDEFGLSGTSSTTLTVFVNEPVASATASALDVGCAEPITFDGSGSSHPNPDRSIVSYAWDFGDGTTGSGVTVTHTYFGNGNFTATLTVTDDNSPPRTDADSLTISVNWPNHTPVASHGGPYTVSLGEGLTLNGSGSSDPDTACGDSIVAYEWDLRNDGSIDHTGVTPTVTAQEVDTLGAGTHQVRLTVRDEFGTQSVAMTTLTVSGSPATISGDLSCNSVNGNGFASNSSVSVTVKDAPGGTTVYTNPSVPTDGTGNLNLFCGFGPDLVPGMEITVSGGGDTKVLVLTDLTIDSVNPATDVVSGTAPANASVFVGVSNPPSGGAALTTTADGTGAWSVDFTGTFDITGGTHANASVSDADGDRTFVNKLPATISGDLSCNSVNGNGFAPNSSVSVTVKDAPGGTTVYDNPTVPTDGTGNFNLFCGFGPDLTPGMEITVSGGSDTKVLVLADLAIDSVDPATDVVSGTAPANSSVFVGVNNPPGPEGAGQNTTADGTGAWSVDFTGTFDITGGTHANASVADGDGDNTFVNKPPATINGDITNDGIGGGGFDPNATVTIEVRDSPGGSLLVTATVLGDGQGNFNLCCGAEVGLPDLVPGMEITASQGATTKVLVLVNITIDSVDAATDVVSGTAPANSSVFVGVNNPPGPGGAGQNTTADGSGNWTVDFTGTFDITAGTNANASVSDADGDTTNFNRQAPSINGNITDDFIGGEGFEPSATVTVEVRDAPGGTLVFTGASPTDGGGSFGLCCGPEVGLPDLVPGMEITVSDGSSAKVLVLAALTIDSLDLANDGVSGTAPANSLLFVGVNNSFGEAGLNTTADGVGNWSVDFTGTFDIDALTQANVQVFDDDGDATSAQKRPPTIHASYCCLGNINGEDFTPNASVTLEIFDSPGGTLLLSQVVPTDRFGFFELNLEITGVSLSPGMQVVATDDTTSDSKELTLEPLTFDALNPSADTASGTAQPGTTVLVEIFADPGASLEVVADGSGSWVADFGAIAFDVTSAMGAIARVPDADGDTTDDEVFTPTISGSVLSDFVSGSDFTPNASVDVQIFDSPGGALLFSGSVATGGEFGDFGVGFEIHGVDLVPGTHIVVTDGVTTATKELTLVSMSFDVLDPVTDTASGTAPPNATVVLEVFDSGGEFFKETVADGAGRWTVDLGAEGFDVIQGGGNATVRDDDGDGTVADRGVPTFSATLTTDEVSGYSFTNSSIVTVEIFDSPGGALLFSGSAPVGSDSTFSLGSGTHGVDLAPGMHITLMDDTTSITKELTLVSITFDVLDPVNDIASGTAPPGMRLGLQFPEGGGETAPADENGDWFADLGAGGGDITPDISATICAVDGDGDCTAAEYVPEADLLLLKTDPPGRQPTGRNMTYTLTVSNVGPKAAYEATATDVLPSSVTFVSATPTQGSCGHSGGTVTCNLGTIASGATVTIAIVVRPTVAGTIVNTASVGASTPDPNNNNNVDAENTSICRITSRRSSIPCG